MGWKENIQVFEDTVQWYTTHPLLRDGIARSTALQQVIPESACIERARARYESPAQIFVSPKRSFEAASAHAGKRVCVLNFASSINPGGGVKSGSSAQEEALCRCSTLCPCLNAEEAWAQFYHPHRAAENPLHNDDCIYTPDVIIFKSDEAYPRILPEESWFKSDIITCAAPNLRPMPGNIMSPSDDISAKDIQPEALAALHKARLRRILDIAAAHGVEIMILGAFGCGVFRNDPNIVARAMHAVALEYAHMFEKIEFAVYCNPANPTNYDTFRSVIGEGKSF